MTGVATVGAVSAIRPPNPSEVGSARDSVTVNVRDHGARGDGSWDDTGAVVRALERAASSGSSATLYFPSGFYRVSAGVMKVADGHSMVIRGDGPDATRIALPVGEQSFLPLLTLDSLYAAVQDLQLDGADAGGESDLLVLNRAYTRVSNCLLSQAPGTALAIGRDGRALAHVVENLVVRDAAAYGIRVHGTAGNATTGSTDGLWSNVDVGRSGASGVFLESSSQNMSNVHVWQSGVRTDDASDRNGFRVTSRSHIFAGCQAERNHGDGFRFEDGGGEGCIVNGCRIWENGNTGLIGVDARRLSISGSTFARNGRNNVGDTASKTTRDAAAIRNEGGTDWVITGCLIWDDEQALQPVEVPPNSTAPKIPERGRSMSQTFAYVETGEDGKNVITGGVLRAEDQLSSRAIQTTSPFLRVNGTDLGGDIVPSVASADSIEAPPWADVIRITGTTAITKIRASRPGRSVTLIFASDGAPGLRGSASGLRLRDDFTPGAGGTISLVHASGTWYEQSRTT